MNLFQTGFVSPDSAAPAGGAGEPRAYSIRASLTALVMACLVPAIVVSAALVVQDYRMQKDRLYRETLVLARVLTSALDREFAGIESGLRVLASSSDLAAGDLASFHQRATQALKFQMASHYMLVDRAGQQHLNTLLPHGSAPPSGSVPSELQRVVETQTPVLTDLYRAGASGQPTLAIGVPVVRGDAVPYALAVGLSADRVGGLLKRQELPDGWIAAVMDGTGTIVARTRDADAFVGQKAAGPIATRVTSEREATLETDTKEGIPVVLSFSRSPVSRWSVMVAAPRALVSAELYRWIAVVVAGAALALGLGLCLASRLAGKIAVSVHGLIAPALALGHGRPVEIAPTWMTEVRAVGDALTQAEARLTHAQHLAHHDGLTGLANRVLFDALLKRQLALAQRYNAHLTVLAIDLNDFKSINDLYGHSTGDRVLNTVADRITRSIRASDVAARIGGDEFAVMLIGADLDSAWTIANKLMANMAQPFPDTLPRASISVGIAVFPESGIDAAELLDSADRALYDAKRSGQLEFDRAT